MRYPDIYKEKSIHENCSVFASGLDNPSYLLIEVNEDELRYENINISNAQS